MPSHSLAVFLLPAILLVSLTEIVETTDCQIPSNNIVNQLFIDEVIAGGGEGNTATIRGGPYYVCQVQGTTMGTYQELSVIMEYTSVSGDRVGQFEMICQVSLDGWGRRFDSFTVLSSGPGVVYDGSIGLKTNCSSCINTAGNDQHCVVCELSSCSDGYTVNSTSCTCTLTDICVADNPCNSNGVCILDTAPDQYTCNCTGTGYTGANCTVCPECPVGYSMITSNCSCYQSHICLIDNPCNNGGNCTIQDGDNNYTCTCTNDYNGTNCTDCTLECPDGYIIDDDCYVCLLDDICVADNPCINNGTCAHVSKCVPENYTCNCTGTGYTGTNCTDNVTTSINATCPQTCVSGPTPEEYTCNCTGTGYTGTNCTDLSSNRDNGADSIKDIQDFPIIVSTLSSIIVVLLILLSISVGFNLCRIIRKQLQKKSSKNQLPSETNSCNEKRKIASCKSMEEDNPSPHNYTEMNSLGLAEAYATTSDQDGSIYDEPGPPTDIAYTYI